MNINKMKIILMLILAILLSQLAGCGRSGGRYNDASDQSSYVFTMGTVFNIRVLADDAEGIVQNLEQGLYACDDLISWRKEGSLAEQFNSGQEANVSEIREMIEDALRVSHDSKGAFDLTVLPLSRLWDFDRMGDSGFDISGMEVPDSSDIEKVRRKVDYTQLVYNEESGILSTENPETRIELGAVGKGYAIEKAREMLAASDASGGLISAGSSICVYGTKKDGSNFRTAIRDPRGDTDAAIGILSLTDSTISTSGDYERYFEKDGVRYHHILDPRTGYPADSGLMQVTIICDDGILGDALSTACFVLGLEEGMALADQYGVLAIFVDADKNVWYNSPTVLEMFEFMGKNSGYILKEYN